jgi:hypothetical protein
MSPVDAHARKPARIAADSGIIEAVRLGACVLVALVGTARADDVDDLVAKGEDAAKQLQFSQAIQAFKAADAKRPRAKHACLIGLAYTRRELWPQAELFFAACHARATADDPLPDWVGAAETQLAAKLAAIDVAAITIVVSAPNAKLTVSSFEPDETFPPRTIHLAHGKHVIEASAPGFETATREVVVTTNAPQTIAIELHPPPPPPPPPPPLAPRIVIAGGAALAVAGGAYQLFAYKPARDKLASAPNVFAYDAAKHTFEVRRDVTLAIYGAAVVTLAIGIVLELRGHHTPRDTTLAWRF